MHNIVRDEDNGTNNLKYHRNIWKTTNTTYLIRFEMAGISIPAYILRRHACCIWEHCLTWLWNSCITYYFVLIALYTPPLSVSQLQLCHYQRFQSSLIPLYYSFQRSGVHIDYRISPISTVFLFQPLFHLSAELVILQFLHPNDFELPN